MYAVATREGAELLLVLRIRRGRDGSVFVMWPRDPDSDPHTTYHADGRYHQKTDDKALSPRMRQPLDDSFRGSEMVVGTGFTAGEPGAVKEAAEKRGDIVVVDPIKFTDVFEIPASELKPTWSNSLSVHLIQDGQPLTDLQGMMPGVRVVKQETYGDGAPWLVVTFVEPNPRYSKPGPENLEE